MPGSSAGCTGSTALTSASDEGLRMLSFMMELERAGVCRDHMARQRGDAKLSLTASSCGN